MLFQLVAKSILFSSVEFNLMYWNNKLNMKFKFIKTKQIKHKNENEHNTQKLTLSAIKVKAEMFLIDIFLGLFW